MIHYHGTPCGGPRQDVARFLQGRHSLIPFPRPEDIGTAAEVCQSFVIDNGAYTAWKQGQPVADWNPYYEFVAKWCRHPSFDWAFIPDVIDGDESANDSLRCDWPSELKRYGVPIWHMHESLELLEDLADTHYHTVAIGSSGQWPTPGTESWWNRMAEAMRVVCDKDGRPKVRLHGLRMLDPAIFHRLPLASADSTNAVRNSSGYKRFGMYCPPSNAARMATIADRIETHNSAAIWRPFEEQQVLILSGVQHG